MILATSALGPGNFMSVRFGSGEIAPRAGFELFPGVLILL